MESILTGRPALKQALDEVLRQQPDMKTILNSISLHHSMTPAEVKEKGYTAASYNINVILQHPEWIQEFKDYGIETFFWMVLLGQQLISVM